MLPVRNLMKSYMDTMTPAGQGDLQRARSTCQFVQGIFAEYFLVPSQREFLATITDTTTRETARDMLVNRHRAGASRSPRRTAPVAKVAMCSLSHQEP